VDGKVVAGGDAAIIEGWLANKLERVSADSSGWIPLHKHRDSGQQAQQA
jgi:hypothetical protein